MQSAHAAVQTSALDAHTETELMCNVNTLLQEKSRTSIFIVHRLRTVVEAGACLTALTYTVSLSVLTSRCRCHDCGEGRAAGREGHARRAHAAAQGWAVLQQVSKITSNAAAAATEKQS